MPTTRVGYLHTEQTGLGAQFIFIIPVSLPPISLFLKPSYTSPDTCKAQLAADSSKQPDIYLYISRYVCLCSVD
ncbi:unnamed protein product [Protopolystoma xenopodis]|uniref:Uncharacterized protein n=1 Tax=Protopolystoma xenopodis TaxID=117903 RepID=A0A3S5ANY3_9PLAT|nr:unnamed protein product [Protopolystoma xenopodis]